MRQFIVALAAVCAFTSVATRAECVRPHPDFTIPDGATTSQTDLAAAGQKVVAFDQKVGDYLRCIRGEASQNLVGKDDAARKQVADAYIAAHNAAASELSGLGTCFDEQARKFKASGGGKNPQPVDCKSFIEAAATAPAAAPEPLPNPNLVKEADGHTFDLSDGVWSYTLIRDDTRRLCGADHKQKCVERGLFVRNSSTETLECSGYIEYAGTDIEDKARIEKKAIVAGHGSRLIVDSYAAVDVNAQTFDAQCTPRPALPKLTTPSTCKYEVVKPVSISDFYPDESRKQNEEGPVIVEFTVAGKAANPTDVKVVGSSLLPRLDKAATDAVSAMVLSSACSKQRYRLKLNFQLEQ